MRRTILCLALVSSVFAQTKPDEPTMLEELKKRAPDTFFVVRQDERADAPIQAVFGDLADPPAAGEKAEMPMVRFMVRYRALLGFPDADPIGDLSEVLIRSSNGAGRTQVWLPEKDGFYWPGGSVSFHYDKDGRLVGVVGRYKAMGAVAGGSASIPSVIEKAIEEASRLKGGQKVALSSDGTIMQLLAEQADGSLKKIYRIELIVGEDETAVKAILAADGSVICIGRGGHSFDAAGKGYDGYPVVVDQVEHRLPRLDDAVAGFKHPPLQGEVFVARSSAYYKAKGTKGRFDFPKDFVYTFDSGTKRRLSHPRYLETSMYAHLMQAYEFAKKAGVNELDEPFEKGSTEKPILTFDPWSRPNVKDGVKNNAVYRDSDHSMRFAWYNPVWDFRQTAADASVIYHEYGHAVHYRLNPYWVWNYTPEERGDSGAIGEGFGDYFSMLVSGGSTVMEVLAGSAEVRKGRLDPNYCQILPIYDDADEECKVDGTTEIHPAGQLFSGLAMRLTQSGPEQLGKDEVESAARVFEAVRLCLPTTFRRFALAVMAVQMRHGDAAKLPKLMALWQEAGLFKKCP